VTKFNGVNVKNPSVKISAARPISAINAGRIKNNSFCLFLVSLEEDFGKDCSVMAAGPAAVVVDLSCSQIGGTNEVNDE
jgi:hypothetical protein